ncbi:hypothetical protein BGX38DRAFT_598212 [Terfezia claveryi]|nr:hypothetical protein BGX38DRAFT_598212 [Terfezia claveryi]
MSSRTLPVVNSDFNPIDRDPQEYIHPIGVLPVLAINIESTQSKHEHTEQPEHHAETSKMDEAPPMLEAADLSYQPMIQHLDVKDPPPRPSVVSNQHNTILMEEAASRASSFDQEDSPPPNPSDGDFTTQENPSLIFSSPYLLSRFFTIDHYNESLRHEAGIAASEDRIRDGQNMFIQRVVEIIFGIDTLSESRV